MTEVRLYASHPDYKKFNSMQHKLVMATNPHMFFGSEEILEPERLALVEAIKDAIRESLNEYEYLPPGIAAVINKLEENMQEEEE